MSSLPISPYGRCRRGSACAYVVYEQGRRVGCYAQSNVMAAWLVDVLSQQPPLAELRAERQRAHQSAMFMLATPSIGRRSKDLLGHAPTEGQGSHPGPR